jgi:hypothetical protein
MHIDWKSWKTTVQPILSGTLAITTALLTIQTISPKTAGILIAVQAISKAIIGVMQTDAPAPAVKA